MCDDFTAKADEAALSRRSFTALSAVAALVAYSGAVNAAVPRLRERMVKVPTPDGTADCFFVHPARGKYPGVILWPDIGGNRDAFKLMARRLAGAGYAVLVMNQYYRGSPAPVLASFAEWRTPEGRAKLQPLIATVTPEGTMRDAAAAVAFLDSQRSVDTKRGIGTQGYCMGGPHAVRTAAGASARIRGVASFHGGGLATDKPESPHMLLARTQANYLIAVARNDDARDGTEKDRFRVAADAAGRPVEIEVYAADHGWCVPDAPSYNQAEADRAWARLLALYAKL
jgi:carboxymethylenebutenolidase